MTLRFWDGEEIVSGDVVGIVGPHLSVSATGTDSHGMHWCRACIVSRDRAIDPDQWDDAKRRLEAAALAACEPQHH